jgi:hypothetical protein
MTTPTSGSKRSPWLPPKKISRENHATPPIRKPPTTSTTLARTEDGLLASIVIELRIKHFLFPIGKLILEW